jgi:hypothetical protein
MTFRAGDTPLAPLAGLCDLAGGGVGDITLTGLGDRGVGDVTLIPWEGGVGDVPSAGLCGRGPRSVLRPRNARSLDGKTGIFAIPISSPRFPFPEDDRDPPPFGEKGAFAVTGEPGLELRPSKTARCILDPDPRLGASVNDIVRPDVSIVGRAGLPYGIPGSPRPGDDGRLGRDSGNLGTGV